MSMDEKSENNHVYLLFTLMMSTSDDSYYLNVYYQNLRGIVSKCNVPKLHLTMPVYDYDIITLTETWLHSSVYDINYFLKNIQFIVKLRF